MAEEKIVEVEVSKFGGLNTNSDPHDLPLGTSDSCLNVYGTDDGSWFCKRPGIGAALKSTVNPIIDVIHACPVSTGGTTSPDAIYVLSRKTSDNTLLLDQYDIYNDVLTSITWGTPPADAGGFARLIPGGPTDIFVTMPAAAGSWTVFEHYQDTTPWVRLDTYSSPLSDSTHTWMAAAYYKNTMFWAQHSDQSDSDVVAFSAYGAPRDYTTATNYVNVDQRGRAWPVKGLFDRGDSLLIGGSERVWVLSGASSETYRVDQVSCDFGFTGMRTLVQWKGRAVGIVDRPYPSDKTGMINAWPDNVAVFEGTSAETIGTPILPNLRSTASSYSARMGTYQDLNGVFAVPQIADGSSNCNMYFCNMASGSWWKWAVPAIIGAGSTDRGITSFVDCGSENYTTYAGAGLFTGHNDNSIRKWHSLYAKDGTANMTANWTELLTAKKLGIPQDKPFTIVYVRVYGSQTSGTAPTVQVDTNEASSYSTAKSCTLQSKGYQVSLDIPQGYTQRFKINLSASDGVRQKVYKIVYGIKYFTR